MNYKNITTLGAVALTLAHCSNGVNEQPAANKIEKLPNILWITTEDISPYLGCYGDSNAVTPNLDQLASDGIMYTNAFANAPVSAPARSTIISGMYPTSLGTQHMRSKNPVPQFVKFYPQYLREKGYYCTNNDKTDYNMPQPDSVWHECSKTAHYNNRKPGQPFFAIFNLGTTHESCLHDSLTELQHKPETMIIPPYHPDNASIRHDWAQFYDKITLMDKQVGRLLQELDSVGLTDSTIVFFYGDHGGILARSKRFIYNTGLRVPFIVRFPEAYQSLAPGKPGSKSDRLISFVDLAPTLLSLVDIPVPEHFQGNAFLGKQQKENQYLYFFRGRMDERYDMVRSIANKRYRYAMNFMPHRIYGQHLNYLWRAPSVRAWERDYKSGKCNEIQSRFWNTKSVEELYDMQADPWEINNLAGNPEFDSVRNAMRNELKNWMLETRDCGFIPEGKLVSMQNQTIYDFVQSENYPIDSILAIAEIAIQGKNENIPVLKQKLQHKNSFIRYWAAIGCAIIQNKAASLSEELKACITDDCLEVRIAAAEALYHAGYKIEAKQAIESVLQSNDSKSILFAVNLLQYTDKTFVDKLMPEVNKMLEKIEDHYVKRAVEYLVETYG